MMEKRLDRPLYEVDGKQIGYSDFVSALKSVGVKKGDIIFVHSDISVFGKLCIFSKEDMLKILIDALKESVGENGTIIMPTFSYSFCNGEIYDVVNTKSTVGVLTEFFRKQPGVSRTIHPIFSVGIWGSHKSELLGIGKDCFDEDSIFAKFHEMNGKIIFLGAPFQSCTYIHYVEQMHGIPHRYMKTFKGKIKNDDMEYEDEYTFFVRYLDKNINYDLLRFEKYLLENGLLKEAKLGNGRILMIESDVLFKEGRLLLDDDIFFFLKEPPKNLYEFNLDNLPFYFGIFDSPQIQDFPTSLPFTLTFDEKLGVIIQKSNPIIDNWIKKAYNFGSSVSTPLDSGSFGKKLSEEFITTLNFSIASDGFEGLRFLEVGCNKGYLLHLLKCKGASYCLGVEPDPVSKVGSKRYDIEIINDFFDKSLVKEKFDVVFTHGVLEHIKNPLDFLRDLKDCTKENGIIFTAVPNCELGLSIGDLSILGHEHYNYFTPRSLYNIYQKAGLGSIQYRNANYGWMLYMWGKAKSKRIPVNHSFKENVLKERELFNNYVRLIQNIINKIQGMINNFENEGKSIGIYGAGPTFLLFNWKKQPRFFDVDVAKHSKFLPRCKNPIENPNSLITNPVDSIWITPINYDSTIRNFLVHDLKLPSYKIISMKEIYESIKKNHGTMKKEDIIENLDATKTSKDMYYLMKRLFPICRSITGNGVRETLDIIKENIPIKIHEVPTGTKVFDWTVPKEWNIKDAYVKNSNGKKIIDFRKSNLHVLNYSVPVHKKMGLQELKEHLFTIPDYPDWIPYLTSYYKENWGFCITHKQYEQLEEDNYEVVIDSTLKDGFLTFGELYLKGEREDEVLLTCYICHPSLCNDNLSGTALLTFLAKVLSDNDLKYSYRFLFIPETIGSITWLSMNEDKVSKIKHGLVATCVGDPGKSTYKKSRDGNAAIDKVVEKILIDSGDPYEIIDFFPSGSDERQFSSPGFNLSVGSLMRTPYACFPEYHTSADNLDFVGAEYLADSFKKYMDVIFALENNTTYLNLKPKCEPHLGKRGLYKMIGGQKGVEIDAMAIFWVLNLSDGSNSLLDISVRSGMNFKQIKDAANALLRKGLLSEVTKT